jgi:WD40 repeat protein/transcriptional regulator with XRE-family HTH domain
VDPVAIMLPSPYDPGESFRGQLLRLRGRIGLTQLQLAAEIEVHINSVQSWEAGLSCPSAASLRRLIAAILRLGGFNVGREQSEASALWTAAQDASPRLRTPFDRTWFQGLLGDTDSPGVSTIEDDVVWLTPAARDARRQSWGDAPDVDSFLGRASERALLSQWVLEDRSRVVAVLGLGGIGKSLLAARVARDVAPSFERVFWRSLRDAPTPGEWIAEAIEFLAPNDPSPSQAESVQARRLLELLSKARCLLVLDNFETVLQPGSRAGEYRPGYESYGTVLRQVAEARHQSCLIVTSREEPRELGPLRGERGPVRTVVLTGLRVEEGRAMLSDKQLDGDAAAWQALVEHCGGNGLALKVVGDTTRELFGGSISDFLEFATATPGVLVGGVRQLLRAQIRRLSDPEQDLLRCMAVAREPVGLAELAANLGPRISRAATLEAVEGLRRRSLLERIERGPLFGLHPVVLEYVTELLIEDVAHELVRGEPGLLLRQPLLKATGNDYVRRTQERLICAAIVERLVHECMHAERAEQRLLELLDQQRSRPKEDHGYGPGNLVNLLRLLRGDLRGADLSSLVIRQAFLQDVEAQDADLTGGHLTETVLGGAFSYPTSVAISADGAYLIAGTSAGEVCVWRCSDRTLVATLSGHSAGVRSVAIADDGQLAASGSADGTIRVWDTTHGMPLAMLPGHGGGVWGVALSRDGSTVVGSGEDSTAYLWNAVSGQLVARLDGHTGGIRGVAVVGNLGLVATCGMNGTVQLWDSTSGQPTVLLQGHTGAVWCVASSADGRLAASGSADRTVQVWETASGRRIATAHGHTGQVWCVALSRDGQILASGSEDRTVRLWEAMSGRLVATLEGHGSSVRGVALSGDGHVVASGGVDGTLRLWRAESGHPLATLRGHTLGVLGVAASRDGRFVASGNVDGAVRVWESESGRLLTTLQGHIGGVWGVAMSQDGRLLVSCSYDATIRLWDVVRGRPLRTIEGHRDGIRDVAVHGDGRLVVSGGADGMVRVWDVETGHPLAALHGHGELIMDVALSHAGDVAASAGYDGTVRLWDIADDRAIATLRGHTGAVFSVAISGDARLAASGGADGTVKLWDVGRQRLLMTLEGHAASVWGVALSGDGRLVASSSEDRTVRLWDTASGHLIATLEGHTGLVYSVDLSEDGHLAVSGGVDGIVRVWDTSRARILRTLRADRRYERMRISGLTGITDAQRGALLALGAIDYGDTSRE